MNNKFSQSLLMNKVGALVLLISSFTLVMQYLIAPSSAAGNFTANKLTQTSKQNKGNSLGGDKIQLEDTDVNMEDGQFNITSLISNNNNLYVQIKKDKLFKVTNKYIHPNCQTLIDSYKDTFATFKSSDTRLSNKVVNLIAGEMQAQYKALSQLPIKDQEYTCFLYNLYAYAESAKDANNVTLSNTSPVEATPAKTDDTSVSNDESE